MNYGDWYLDLSAMVELTKDEQDNIHSYYREMLHSELDNRKSIAQSFFHTLQKAGYIKNATQENRDELKGLVGPTGPVGMPGPIGIPVINFFRKPKIKKILDKI